MLGDKNGTKNQEILKVTNDNVTKELVPVENQEYPLNENEVKLILVQRLIILLDENK